MAANTCQPSWKTGEAVTMKVFVTLFILGIGCAFLFVTLLSPLKSMQYLQVPSGFETITVWASQGDLDFLITLNCSISSKASNTASLWEADNRQGVTLTILSLTTFILCLVLILGIIVSPFLINILLWLFIVSGVFFVGLHYQLQPLPPTHPLVWLFPHL